MLTEGTGRAKTSRVTRKDLHDVPLPTSLKKWEKKGKPKNSYWEPVQHGELADLVVGTLMELDIDVLDEKWILCREGMGLIGDIEVMPKTTARDWTEGVSTYGDFVAKQLGMHFLVRHSNDAVWSLDFLAGAKVEVCSNGMIITKFGSITVKRKHSKEIYLPDYVRDSVSAVCQNFGTIVQTRDQMISIPISNPEGDYLCVEAARRGVIPNSYVVPVANAWRKPAHEEFKGRNGWGLYNAFTELAKKRSTTDQIDMIRESGDLVLEFGKKSGRLQLEA